MTKEDKLKLMCTLLVPFSEHAAKTYASEEAFDDYARGAIEKVDRILERAVQRCDVTFEDPLPNATEIFAEVERQAVKIVEQRESVEAGNRSRPILGNDLCSDIYLAFVAVRGARLPMRRCSICKSFICWVATPDNGMFGLSCDTSCDCSKGAENMHEMVTVSEYDAFLRYLKQFPDDLRERMLRTFKDPELDAYKGNELFVTLSRFMIEHGHD